MRGPPGSLALILLDFAVRYIQRLDGAIRNGRHDPAIMNQFWSQIVVVV